jgi:hypothetical protein
MEPKKRSLAAGERDEFLRAAWRTLVAKEVDAKQFVFVDEMGANISLSALSALSAMDARAFFAHCGYREVVQTLGQTL